MDANAAPDGAAIARVEAATIAAELAGRIESLAITLTGQKPTSRSRHEVRFRSRGSLSVNIGGSHRGTFKDYENGPHGDPIDLIRHLRGCGFREALQWAVAWLGLPQPINADRPTARPQRRSETGSVGTLDLARRIWVEATDPRSTIVEAYLRGRGLMLEPSLPIRFHPACPRGSERLPAMVALMTDAITGEPCGVHRTFLRPEGGGKAEGTAKMMAGHAGVLRLSSDSSVTTGIGICEGIETGLSIVQAFGWRPVWACASAGGISRFPVLPGIEALTVFSDGDATGMEAAETCCERWRGAGCEAEIWAAPARADFNDVAKEAA